ncbi:PREDICTED: putative oxidoreductase TDA3 isoform X2 [Brassica oleracea var. oleracea]|uniref:FAD dependent oxidoreductase domain-containing protein n=1 Tax=Brassica oleracea var. oleracea TaxID=109376 RepID=A0A0D3CM47_BRAOL|nr:PREDICTED: putative oxidoreductase TDA3 isoform X2 [Brassica oleracea var. oleracea]
MALISSSSFPPALSRRLTHTRTITIRSNSSKPMAKNLADGGETSKRIVVCGGGVIGVCTAYFLAKKGVSVTLVEQSAVACAASGKAGGFLAFDWCDGSPVGSLARASFDLHRSLAEELNGVESYGYRPLTTLSVTVKESKPVSGGLGLPDWVNGPVKSPSTIGTTQTTAQVHPQLFTRKVLSTAVEKYGVEVVIGRLEEVRVEQGRVDSVVLEGGRVIEADSVVLAMGPWSDKLEMLSSVFRVYGTKAHSIVLEPKEPNAITPHALFLSYYPSNGGGALDPEVYPRPTGEVYLCGMSSQEEVPDDPDQVTSNPESIEVLKRVAKTVSSYLNEESAQVKAEQACFLPSTEDGVPVIGEIPGIKGCYVATGHSCWGILNGPATGSALAELIVDGVATSVDLSRFSPSRFSKRR